MANQKTWEVRFTAVTADQLDKPQGQIQNMMMYLQSSIFSQKFWANIMQWDDYALSQAYENYRIIIKAKVARNEPQMMFIESGCL